MTLGGSLLGNCFKAMWFNATHAGKSVPFGMGAARRNSTRLSGSRTATVFEASANKNLTAGSNEFAFAVAAKILNAHK